MRFSISQRWLDNFGMKNSGDEFGGRGGVEKPFLVI